MSFNANTKSAVKASEQGYTFEPVWPDTGNKIGATITVRGPRSMLVREYARTKLDEAQHRDLQARQKGRKPTPRNLEEIEDSMLELAVIYTMAWDGVERDDGTPIPCTPESARALYIDHPWLRDQVIEEAQALGNFVRPGSTSSTSTAAPSSSST